MIGFVTVAGAVVVARAPSRGMRTFWACKCSCGNEFEAHGTKLRRNLIQRCKACRAKFTGDRSRTHGKSKTSEYIIWSKLRERCNNPTSPAYASYGGRGITVCARWSSFERFLEDMGPRPSRNYSVDRIDNDGNYEPENCKWATQKEQCRNTRRNHYLEYQGRIQCMQAWCEELGLNPDTVKQRINLLGWSVAKSFETPVRSLRRVHPP